MQRGPVLLETDAKNAMARAANQAAPREMVGLVGGRTDHGVLHVVHFAPLPDGLCGTDHFAVAPWTFAAAEAALRAQGLRWLGFAHSHPAGAPVPSPTDARELWPHCLQLVLGLMHGEPAIGAFWLDAAGVHELPLRGAWGGR